METKYYIQDTTLAYAELFFKNYWDHRNTLELIPNISVPSYTVGQFSCLIWTFKNADFRSFLCMSSMKLPWILIQHLKQQKAKNSPKLLNILYVFLCVSAH